jgi:mediator of RNA polymerase II transcription subunit 6
MSVTNLLGKFHETAAAMQFFTPATGHTYFPPMGKPKAKPGLESTRTSRANSPMPDSSSQTGSMSQTTKDVPEVNDDTAIYESFNMALRWGSEYMDENPLVGEPGSFVLAHSSRNLKDQREKREVASEVVKSIENRASQTPSTAPTPLRTLEPPKKVATGTKLKSPTGPVADAGVKKRRKSKAPGTPGVSPISPQSTKAPGTPRAKPMSPPAA